MSVLQRRDSLVVELQVRRLDHGGNAFDVLVNHGAEIGAGIAARGDVSGADCTRG